MNTQSEFNIEGITCCSHWSLFIVGTLIIHWEFRTKKILTILNFLLWFFHDKEQNVTLRQNHTYGVCVHSVDENCFDLREEQEP